MQSYLRSEKLHPEEACKITALRSNCVKNVKSNFSAMHKNIIHCPLLCKLTLKYVKPLTLKTPQN